MILAMNNEIVGVKRGSWDARGAFIYSTLSQIKYILPDGENGVVRSLDYPFYLTHIENSYAFGVDRERRIRKLIFDPTEYIFKISLKSHHTSEVKKILQSGRLCGQNLVKFLQTNGYSEVALHFVNDKETRLQLALECGDFDIAIEMAMSLDKEEYWNLLGDEALKRGKISITEMAYQRTKNFEKLSFLYLITGNRENLGKMIRISEIRENTLAIYQNSLYYGSPIDRIKALKNAGIYPLAYITAFHYSLTEEMEQIKDKLIQMRIPIPELPAEPNPILPNQNQSLIKDTDVLPPKISFFSLPDNTAQAANRAPTGPFAPSKTEVEEEVEEEVETESKF